MRKALIASVISIATAAGPAWGGLYIPGEEPDFVSTDGKVQEFAFDQFRIKLNDVLSIVVDKTVSEPRKQYLKRAADLRARNMERQSPADLVSFGECLVRLGDLEKSFLAYHTAARRDPRSFLALSGLAAVHQMRGELLQARETQRDALSLRPKQLPGMSPAQSAWLLSVEQRFAELQKGRLREAREKTPLSDLAPDDLFGVTFVGNSGAYEAGTIADHDRSKLPADAVAVVQQLLLWFPHDARLVWLLGELYNTTGQMREALTLFDDCMFVRSFQTAQLREHKRIVQERLEQISAAEQQQRLEAEEKQFSKHPEVLWTVAVVGGTLIMLLAVWQSWIFVRRMRSNRHCPQC
jgi:tetratricopeptide (TPR) repeat protein